VELNECHGLGVSGAWQVADLLCLVDPSGLKPTIAGRCQGIGNVLVTLGKCRKNPIARLAAGGRVAPVSQACRIGRAMQHVLVGRSVLESRIDVKAIDEIDAVALELWGDLRWG
jgi:hypothetical protein